MRTSALGGLLWIVAASLTAAAAERWQMQLFHDEDKSSLSLADIAFPTAQRGLAIGALEEKGDRRPVTLVTTDGGAHWTYAKSPDYGRALFCLDETACWMAGARGVWFSTEAGRDWRRVLGRNGITNVYFRTRERGWAVGADKTVLETADGGKHWKSVKGVDEVKASTDRTVFYGIGFVGKGGMITGRSEPRVTAPVPLWMDPDVEERRELPTLTVILQTNDGGDTWSAGTASIFGRIARLALSPDGRGLALLEYDRWFRYASELVRLDLHTGMSDSSLQRSDVRVTDMAILNKGPAFAVGVEPLGRLAQAPIPGKLQVLTSVDLKTWLAMPVDYRAVAHRASIAVLDASHAWIATDTGMILRLVRD